jgi:hypothetical protein
LFELIETGEAAVPNKFALVVVLYEAPDELLANVIILPAVEHSKLAQVQPAEPVNVTFPVNPNVKLFEIALATLEVIVAIPGTAKLYQDIPLTVDVPKVIVEVPGLTDPAV